VQVRLAYGGVCGSDLHYYQEGKVGNFVVREPLVVGHEVVGRVVADPRAQTDPEHALAPGTPVTIHPATLGTPLPGLEDRPSIWPEGRYLGSAATWPHTQGAMSDLFTARADQIRVLPAGLPLERGVLAEPLGVALGAAEVTVTDMLAEPLGTARQLGVTRTLQVGVDEIPAQAFDVVVECAGAPAALSQAIQSVVRGGVVVQVGMLPGDARPVALAELVSRGIDLRGSFRFDDEIDQAVELLATHPALGHVVTDVFEPGDAVAAFDRASDARASSKVVLKFDDSLPPADPTAGDIR
ncbi:MAG: zinc-binding dehydrogenase, partial [Cellulomonadaceae bacterium]